MQHESHSIRSKTPLTSPTKDTMSQSARPHLDITGATRAELGRARGEALRGTLGTAYAKYAELFRVSGVSESAEREGAQRTVETIAAWRPEIVAEHEGIAAAAGVDLLHVAALNARTEILALGTGGASECSTLTTIIDGRRVGVQTWDWHIELDEFWHTHTVAGPGYRFAGLTEQGIISKIGVNEAGLALHFNILGHQADGADGVPMHVLSDVVLTECATVTEAIALIRSAKIGSSSSLTMLDADRAVSLELTPAGVFVFDEQSGSVQRTNHFQHATPLAQQKDELYEPDSSARLELIRERLSPGLPADEDALVEVLLTGPGEPPLTSVPDMSLTFGERWATLATIITDPSRRTIRVLDGSPADAATGTWRLLHAN